MFGKYYEELEVGMQFSHLPGRTLSEYDNILFSALTHNPQPLHLDAEFARKSEFQRPLMNSLFTLGLLVGLSVADTTVGTTIANLGFESIDFPKPLFAGDTLYVSTEVVARRESKSRPDAGIVTFEHRGHNQHGELVARCRRNAFMRKRPTP
ncbi:MAG: MaoC family dehydratase [Candidatus Binatia bacterium]